MKFTPQEEEEIIQQQYRDNPELRAYAEKTAKYEPGSLQWEEAVWEDAVWRGSVLAAEHQKRQKQNISGRKISQLYGSAILPLTLVFIYSVAQLIRVGNQSDYMFLLLGSLFSCVGIFAYMIAQSIAEKRKKSFVAMLLYLSGLIPWAFGSYIVFVKGFWSLRYLVDGVTMIVLLKAIIAIFVGYSIVSKFHKITELTNLHKIS